MIQRFRVQNYKALRDVTLDLTPMHVLIGPNDTGKTSLLEALAAICRSADHELPQTFLGPWDGGVLVWKHHRDLPIQLAVEGSIGTIPIVYKLDCGFPEHGRGVINAHEHAEMGAPPEIVDLTLQGVGTTGARYFAQFGKGSQAQQNAARSVQQFIHGVQYCRWDARLLALPVVPQAQRQFRMEPSGFGLALCLDDILGYERDRFDQLEQRFTRLFPQVRSIVLVRQPGYSAPVDDPDMIPKLQAADGKGIYLRFKDSSEVPAAHISDGMLLVLAYITVLYLPQPPRVLLVEEPENGVHPKRLQDVLSILRELVKEQICTQVLLTTHSPYVVDLFKPEDVTLCRKDSDGAVSVHRLSESKTVREQLDVFTLGEIWTAEGDDALAKKDDAVEGAAP
jgi:energy-coupling factor transporter ATP-binding protein EcfA2